MKDVKLASREHIQLYEQTARQFFLDVLALDFDECVVTDESRLSDFSSCGMPDALADNTTSLKSLYAAWDVWVLSELKTRYGLEYVNTVVPLLWLLREVEQYLSLSRHPS